MAARYARAERFCEWNVRPRVRNVTLTPHWTGEGDAFRYRRELPDGVTETVQVDPVTGSSRVVTGPPTPPATARPDRLCSPDGRLELYVQRGDLYVESVADGHRVRLTDDATRHHDYATVSESSTSWLTAHRRGAPVAPVAQWSPDSRCILTHRLDQRHVPELPLVEMHPAEQVRPRLWTYRMPLMGDPLPTAQLVVFDVADLDRPVRHELSDPLLVEFVTPLELGWVWWSADGADVWFLREARGASSLTLCRVAPGQEAHEVLTERAEDYVETHPLLPWPSSVKVTADGTTVIWPSERDGWRHLHLVDVASGAVRQLTRGEWTVREVLAADDDWVWFTGCGREPGRHPYLRHVYRVALTGGEPELLTPEDADHAATFSPSGACFLDTCSTIDTAPVTRLRRADGSLVAELETADLSALHDDGWRPPERFCVKGADGVTDLYGAIYLPSDFDPRRSYPVVDAWYPGPQLIRTPQCFTVDDDAGVDAWPGPWGAQAMAELGVVVLNVDGPGTPLRSRAFHHATYGRLQDHAIEDHLAAVDALAAERPWMDASRLGAQGHSAGAAATVRALLTRPDRYTVGVAGSPVNDLRRYIAYWGEKYQGLLGTFDEDAQSNLGLAGRLEGHLLLLHGELDDNVHPSNTFAMYDAFVRANKDVELVVLAGESHPCWRHPFYVRRSWDTITRHLIGARPPAGYAVAPAPTPPAGPGW
jgi:dipeptidyl-peptidase 4